MQKFIDKFRFNAKRASLVQSRIKALDRMEVLQEVADDPRWNFEFPDPGALGTPVLQVVDVAFGYNPAKPLFRGVEFGIDLESRIALVGPNGSGKSTLLKLILGELEAQSGHISRNAKLRTACFTQHHTAQLDMSMTPLDYLLKLHPGTKPEVVRGHLSSFGLSGDLATQKIYTLSGGQKSRVSFAVISWKKPHILVLDEPTSACAGGRAGRRAGGWAYAPCARAVGREGVRACACAADGCCQTQLPRHLPSHPCADHLDIETIDAVIVALGNFAGGVIVVSHDGHFVESVCDEIWMLGHGSVKKLKGEWKDYRKIALGESAVRRD